MADRGRGFRYPNRICPVYDPRLGGLLHYPPQQPESSGGTALFITRGSPSHFYVSARCPDTRMCTWLSGPDHELTALWIFRVLNATLLAATAALLWRRSRTLKLGPVGRFVLFGMLFLDPKLIDFPRTDRKREYLSSSRYYCGAIGSAGWTARPLAGAGVRRLDVDPSDAFVLAGASCSRICGLTERPTGCAGRSYYVEHFLAGCSTCRGSPGPGGITARRFPIQSWPKLPSTRRAMCLICCSCL